MVRNSEKEFEKSGTIFNQEKGQRGKGPGGPRVPSTIKGGTSAFEGLEFFVLVRTRNPTALHFPMNARWYFRVFQLM